MEADKKQFSSEISQLETVAPPWANRPFSTMAPSTLPLSPTGLSQVWKRPYLLNHFENGESSGGANNRQAHIQPLNIHNTTTFMIPTPTFIPTPSTITNPTTTAAIATATTTTTATATNPDPSATTPALEPIKDKGKKSKEEPDSDANLGNDDKVVTVKTEKEETAYIPVGAVQIRVGRNIAPEGLDPKKLKRIISNRISAQKSRLKRLQYVAEMEKKAKALQEQIAAMNPQIEFFKNHKYFLQLEKSSLNESLSAYEAEQLRKDALIEANKKEIQRLKLLHMKQLEENKLMKLQARILNNPVLNQYQPRNMSYNSDSKLGEKTAAEGFFQKQVREPADQKPDVKSSLGAATGAKIDAAYQ